MSREPTVTGSPTPLVCETCGVEAEGGAVGWMALLGREDADRVAVVLMCPLCVAGEFEVDGPTE